MTLATMLWVRNNLHAVKMQAWKLWQSSTALKVEPRAAPDAEAGPGYCMQPASNCTLCFRQ